MIDKLCEEITRQLEVNNNEKSKTTRENNSHIKTINLDSRKESNAKTSEALKKTISSKNIDTN